MAEENQKELALENVKDWICIALSICLILFMILSICMVFEIKELRQKTTYEPCNCKICQPCPTIPKEKECTPVICSCQPDQDSNEDMWQNIKQKGYNNI